MRLLIGVGKTLAPHAMIALVVGLILFYVIQFTQNITKERIENEDLKDQIEIRESIDNAVRKNPDPSKPVNDTSDSLQYLMERGK